MVLEVFGLDTKAGGGDGVAVTILGLLIVALIVAAGAFLAVRAGWW